MTGPDVSRLSPADVTAALRSFPRRYREAMAAHPDEDLDDLANRAGPTGASATEALVDAVSSLAVLERGLSEIVNSENPVLHPSVLDPTMGEWSPPPSLDVAGLLDMLDDQAADLARVVEKVATADWSRTGRVADGPTVSAMGLAREAARVGAENLGVARDALAAARV